jgi:hypothetical protein
MAHERPGFWTGGRAAYKAALSAEEAERLAPLKAELATAPAPSRTAELVARIAIIRREYREQRQAGKGSLFLGS